MENNFNSFDIPNGMVYNNGRNAINERVANSYDVPVDITKMDEQAPANDVDCRHENLVADENDVIGDAVYHGCVNRKCGVGFYINRQI